VVAGDEVPGAFGMAALAMLGAAVAVRRKRRRIG
jgi:MYXO-CTERM domain-containing protein